MTSPSALSAVVGEFFGSVDEDRCDFGSLLAEGLEVGGEVGGFIAAA